jgi:hypothetical protein
VGQKVRIGRPSQSPKSPKIHGCRKDHIAAAQENQEGQEIRRGRLSWPSRSLEIQKCRIDHITEKSDEQKVHQRPYIPEVRRIRRCRGDHIPRKSGKPGARSRCIRQPRPCVYLKEGTYHTRLFRGPNTNGMKKWDGPSLSWPTPHTTPLFLPPEDPSLVLLRPNSIPG